MQSATTQAQHCPAQETALQYVQDSLCNEVGYCKAARSVLHRVMWSSQQGNGLHVCMWRCTHMVFIYMPPASILKQLRYSSENTTHQVLYWGRELPDSDIWFYLLSFCHPEAYSSLWGITPIPLQGWNSTTCPCLHRDQSYQPHTFTPNQ